MVKTICLFAIVACLLAIPSILALSILEPSFLEPIAPSLSLHLSTLNNKSKFMLVGASCVIVIGVLQALNPDNKPHDEEE